MTVPFQTAIEGVQVQVTVPKETTCANCNGTAAEPGSKAVTEVRRPRVEPLAPDDDDALDRVSLTRSFQTFFPSFDEIFDRLWSNFRDLTRPKSERIESLTVEIPITPLQALAIAVVLSASSVVRVFANGELVGEILPELRLIGRDSLYIKKPHVEESKDEKITVATKEE